MISQYNRQSFVSSVHLLNDYMKELILMSTGSWVSSKVLRRIHTKTQVVSPKARQSASPYIDVTYSAYFDSEICRVVPQ